MISYFETSSYVNVILMILFLGYNIKCSPTIAQKFKSKTQGEDQSPKTMCKQKLHNTQNIAK